MSIFTAARRSIHFCGAKSSCVLLQLGAEIRVCESYTPSKFGDTCTYLQSLATSLMLHFQAGSWARSRKLPPDPLRNCSPEPPRATLRSQPQSCSRPLREAPRRTPYVSGVGDTAKYCCLGVFGLCQMIFKNLPTSYGFTLDILCSP